MRYFAIVFSSLILSGCSMFGDFEKPDYEVISNDGDFEIRQYQGEIVAEVNVTGSRSDATGKGFRILADYIFGNNIKQEEISMTAPVNVQKDISEKIDMTAPVNVVEEEENSWAVQFYMPSKYSLKTLPKPKNDEIKLYKTEGFIAAAIKFSGRWSDSNIAEHNEKLKDYIADNEDYKIISAPIFAFYNDPFTPWFLRRNEVIYKVAEVEAEGEAQTE